MERVCGEMEKASGKTANKDGGKRLSPALDGLLLGYMNGTRESCRPPPASSVTESNDLA